MMIHAENVTVSPAMPAVGTPEVRFFNRDLSWLDFNARVLHEATDMRNPLLERLKFLAIFASNTDEFFMKRIGLMKRWIVNKPNEMGTDGLTHRRQLELVRQRLAELAELQQNIWSRELRPQLAQAGILLQHYEDLNENQRMRAAEYFTRYIFPVLTPLAVDPGHPFPFISNLSVSIGVLLRQPGLPESLFARIKVPRLFPRWFKLEEPAGLIFIPLESLIQGQLELLFPGMHILESKIFRVTRSAEVEAAEDIEDSEDLLEEVQEELRARRFAETVRVQISPGMSEEMRHYLTDGLELHSEDLEEEPEPLGLADMMSLATLDLPALRLPNWTPICAPALADSEASIFAIIRQNDILVHHPYESFNSSVERFILSAVQDPDVLAIKMTLYRTSGDSPFVPALAKAVEMGKQVAVLVELKARFDEESNIQWAQALENAGAHVVYGILGLKTHTKIALVVRRENGVVKSYAHISTGNYNSRTAEVYTDLGLFTCREDICEDVVNLFSFLTGRSRKSDYHKLLVAPVTMRRRFLDMIQRETSAAQSGGPAHIIAKMNALEDTEIIEALYGASRAGVKIDLIVRGFCCLRPGVPGLSENIRVLSIIGRFLEHSRIFYFYNRGQEEIYMGSADWMSRNLSHRVEAATPVENPLLRQRIREILDIMLNDNRQAWNLSASGQWTQRQPADGEPDRGSQTRLMELAIRR
ncbi:MAG: polyphosphate kinase 1 [Planctomycetia bacterium]|nr:polyphosphate kinase 1 [Planctomycetia bacterium]